jgi:PAS domain S-box-containing protein
MVPDPDGELAPAFFARMVETVGVGVGIYDGDGRYIYVNGAYADLFDVDRGTLVGTSLWETNPEFDPDRFDRYWASFGTGETRTAETVHEYDGIAVPVATVTTRRMIDGTPYHFGTIRDISEQKARERELERQNERLDAFASVVSHDLRNPLSVAKGYLDILRDDVDRQELRMVGNALERMDSLITELLSLARSGEAISESEPVSLEGIATRAWETVDTATATLAVVDRDVDIIADSSRLRQLLANLFRNSIEHGGSTVDVTVGRTDEGFYVADDGPGIPPADREQVFTAGYTTADDGTGFGLHIVRQLVNAHGWEIRVERSDDGGARFEITDVEFEE